MKSALSRCTLRDGCCGRTEKKDVQLLSVVMRMVGTDGSEDSHKVAKWWGDAML